MPDTYLRQRRRAAATILIEVPDERVAIAEADSTRHYYRGSAAPRVETLEDAIAESLVFANRLLRGCGLEIRPGRIVIEPLVAETPDEHEPMGEQT